MYITFIVPFLHTQRIIPKIYFSSSQQENSGKSPMSPVVHQEIYSYDENMFKILRKLLFRRYQLFRQIFDLNMLISRGI